MSGHTKGPWEVHAQNPGCGSFRIFAGTRFVGNIGNSDNADGGDNANAHLIAAAPDLLEALENLIFEIDSRSLAGRLDGNSALVLFVNAGRSAIAKANGGAA